MDDVTYESGCRTTIEDWIGDCEWLTFGEEEEEEEEEEEINNQ